MSYNDDTYLAYLRLAIDFSLMCVIQIVMKETYCPSAREPENRPLVVVIYLDYLCCACCLFTRLLKMLSPK